MMMTSTCAEPGSRTPSSERVSRQAFFALATLLFAVSATVTIVGCNAMSAMSEMPMPGGWTMSMAWMRMPGQSWSMVAASFLGMWVAMMVTMMLPSLVPMLLRYRRAVATVRVATLDRMTTLVSAGYFLVWILLGIAAFPVGVALAAIEMRQPALGHAVPMPIGFVVLIAGAVQFTAWKARRLACCREVPVLDPTFADAPAWLRHGVRLGLHCSGCCANLVAIQLVVGMMDLRAMALVTAAITAERLAPSGARAARAIGVAVVAAGLLLVARATFSLV